MEWGECLQSFVFRKFGHTGICRESGSLFLFPLEELRVCDACFVRVNDAVQTNVLRFLLETVFPSGLWYLHDTVTLICNSYGGVPPCVFALDSPNN